MLVHPMAKVRAASDLCEHVFNNERSIGLLQDVQNDVTQALLACPLEPLLQDFFGAVAKETILPGACLS